MKRRDSCTRSTRCGCASSALPPPASPSFPPQSVCLLLALSVCSAAPRLPTTGTTRSCPLLAGAQSRRAPARRARAAAWGPLSGGLSVRRRGPGTRSAAERRVAGYKPLGFRRVYFAPWELHQIWRSEKELCLICRYDRRLPESCFLCHFLWRPVFAICGFFLLLVGTLQGGGNIQS